MKLNLLVATTLLALATQAAPQTAPTPVTDFNELQKEITNNNNSSSGDAKLSIDANLTADANLVEVSKSLTLTGKEATKTLDGAKAHKGFVVKETGTKLTLKDLLLQNFHASAVTVESGSVADITNVTFSGNSASGNGGAIANYGTATIANSFFTSNSASGSGGAIYNFGDKVDVTNAAFTGNSADGDGGAICNDGGAPATITNAIFKNNSAINGGGGAIANYGTATIANSSFTGNSASKGGAIANYGTATITNSSFTGNSAGGNGGAIANYNGTATITNATFSNNSAIHGGAIYNYNGTAMITNTKFENNKAIGNGGAIYNLAPSGNGGATITNSFFTSNNASGNGGAIYNYVGATTDITDTIFTSNSADGDGGAIYNEQWAKIANSSFSSNSASNGGAIYNQDHSVEITNSSFSSNSASNGGAIYNSCGTVDITNATFSNNNAVNSNGGAIYNAVGNVEITNATFSNNNAVNGNGGAIYNEGTATITDATFSNNNAVNGNGGAIYNYNWVGITNATFTGNSAGGSGGAIYNGGATTGERVDITNATFTSNNAGGNGGAIYNSWGTVDITNATFWNNSASGNGGAIYNQGTAMITNGSFSNNSAVVGGGAIYNEGTATITNCSFSGNRATNGGAIYNALGATMNIFANAANVEFTGNTAAGVSNAIYNEGIVNFTSAAGKVIVNDAITGGEGGDHQLNVGVNSTVSFNGDVSGNTLNVNGGKVDFGDKGKFNDREHSIWFENGSTLNLANGKISEAIIAKDVSVISSGTANVVVDVDLANKAVDSIQAGSSYGGGTFQFENFRMLSDAATADAQKVTVFTGTAKPTMGVAGKTFTSNYAYDVTANDKGELTFTRGNNKVDGVLSALHAASGVVSTGAALSVTPMGAMGGTTVSLSLTDDYNATGNLARTSLQNGGELTVFGQGKTLYGNGFSGFNVAETYGSDRSILRIKDATLKEFNSALTVGAGSCAGMTGVNFTENTGAIVNKGEMVFIDCTFTKNVTAGTAGALENVAGTMDIVAMEKDIIFDGNSASGTSNAIHNTSKLYFCALGNRQIVFNDSITGTDTSAMVINGYKSGSGTIVLNADMSGYTGTVEMDGGTLQLGANGTFFDSASSLFLNGGTLDFANGLVQDHRFNKLTLGSGADVKMYVDADLAGSKMDTLSGTASSLNGNKIDVSQIRLLSDAATEKTEILFANDVLKGAVKYSGTAELTYSPLFKYSAAYNDQNGKFTFTRSNSGSYESFNPAVLASPIASQVGGYLTQLATFQQAFMGMERHMLLTSNLRANMSNSAPDTMKAQFDQNDLWIRPYTTYETVELDHGPNVDNVAWGTIVGFDSRLHDLGHEFDGGLSFYAGYNGSQQTYQGKDIVQHGGVLGMTGVLYRGNFFSGLTISGGASQAKADTNYGTDDFTILTAGIAAQTGYNWEVVKDRFIIQPGFSASYTFVKAYDYTTNSGVAIDSDPFHTVTLEPGLKFIGNLDHGWQPYCGVSMVWNLMGETETEANTIALPEMSIKPYVKGNVGVQKLFTDSLSGYLQVYGMGGGRDSIGVQLGFSGAF